MFQARLKAAGEYTAPDMAGSIRFCTKCNAAYESYFHSDGRIRRNCCTECKHNNGKHDHPCNVWTTNQIIENKGIPVNSSEGEPSCAVRNTRKRRKTSEGSTDEGDSRGQRRETSEDF